MDPINPFWSIHNQSTQLVSYIPNLGELYSTYSNFGPKTMIQSKNQPPCPLHLINLLGQQPQHSLHLSRPPCHVKDIPHSS